MKEKHISSSLWTVLLVTVCGVFICTAATTAHAQAGPQQIRTGERENSARENEAMAPTRKRDAKEVLAEVNEDLIQLKGLNESVSTHAAATSQTLNYNSIVVNVTEIKKRSSRLKTNLALPQDEKNKSPDFKDAEKGELQPGLAALNKLLDSFLHNPIFSDAGGIDMQLAAKARRDLEDIIALSDKLRKNADKRSKTSGKTQ
jgi:hypothetical protein